MDVTRESLKLMIKIRWTPLVGQFFNGNKVVDKSLVKLFSCIAL
jgi:hypothetical protein